MSKNKNNDNAYIDMGRAYIDMGRVFPSFVSVSDYKDTRDKAYESLSIDERFNIIQLEQRIISTFIKNIDKAMKILT